jgi:hypothetical protein
MALLGHQNVVLSPHARAIRAVFDELIFSSAVTWVTNTEIEPSVHGRAHAGLRHRHFERLLLIAKTSGECCMGLSVDAAEKYFQIQSPPTTLIAKATPFSP